MDLTFPIRWVIPGKRAHWLRPGHHNWDKVLILLIAMCVEQRRAQITTPETYITNFWKHVLLHLNFNWPILFIFVWKMQVSRATTSFGDCVTYNSKMGKQLFCFSTRFQIFPLICRLSVIDKDKQWIWTPYPLSLETGLIIHFIRRQRLQIISKVTVLSSCGPKRRARSARHSESQ